MTNEIIDYVKKSWDFSTEAQGIVWIRFPHFETEPGQVQALRYFFLEIAEHLIHVREESWRSEAGRLASIALTNLETSCMYAVKWLFAYITKQKSEEQTD